MILVNAVLGRLPIHYMLSLLLPKNVRDILDGKRRAFIWTGEDKCNGSQCLITWEHVCVSKVAGGLGVKNFLDQNHCLLMKLVHKLLGPDNLPWENWFWCHNPGDLGDGCPSSFLGRIVHEELPRLRALSSMEVGDGSATSFWFDEWLGDCTLALCFPALLSHCRRPHASVRDTLSAGLEHTLQPRLTGQASLELSILNSYILDVHLRDTLDV